jgi:hypothetical protein
VGAWRGSILRIAARGVTLVEVNRPNRQARRRHGKSPEPLRADLRGITFAVLVARVGKLVPADCGFYFSDGDVAYFAALQPLAYPAIIAISQYSDGLGTIAVDETSLYWTDPAQATAGTEATRDFIGKVPRP